VRLEPNTMREKKNVDWTKMEERGDFEGGHKKRQNDGPSHMPKGSFASVATPCPRKARRPPKAPTNSDKGKTNSPKMVKRGKSRVSNTNSQTKQGARGRVNSRSVPRAGQK